MAFSVLAAAMLLTVGTAQATMYRWVDGNGRVQYSDTPPMTFNQSGGAVMNKQGQVIRRTQSEAERRAEAERQAQQKRIQQEPSSNPSTVRLRPCPLKSFKETSKDVKALREAQRGGFSRHASRSGSSP